MCLLNYNKEKKKYKHLTYTERTMIERWYNREHLSKKEIAKRLDKSERTIRREIKRGLTVNLNTYLEKIEVYSADIAHDEYLLNLEAKEQELKIGSNIELVNKIEKMIKEEAAAPTTKKCPYCCEDIPLAAVKCPHCTSDLPKK